MRRAAQALALGAVLALGARADDARPDARTAALRNAKVGAWARYKLSDTLEKRESVVAVDAKLVTFRYEIWSRDRLVSNVQVVRQIDPKPDPRVVANTRAVPEKWSDDKVEIAGQTLKCRVWERGELKIWFSSEVPCEGIVRVAHGAKTSEELVAWGDQPETKR